MPAEPTDETLAARARAGDDAAFQALFERHAPTLRREVRRRLPALLRRKVAESDVIQMAYLGVHESLSQFENRGDGSFKAWLDRIVEHRIADVLRRYVQTAKRGLEHEVSGVNVPRAANVDGGRPTPSALAVAEELREKIESAMTELSDDHRRIVRLVQEEGLTLAAAGQRMGRSPGAAKQLYARALGRLTRLVHGGGYDRHE